MTGEELYMMYVEAMLEQSVGVDEWSQLEESDRAAWNAIAAQVQLNPLEVEEGN